MTSPLLFHNLAKASGEIVFFLILLIWIIGGLMKKAAEASKRSFPQGSAGPQHPAQRPTPAAPRPTLSDFLKRIQQMTEGEEQPPPSPPEPETPTPRPLLQMPSPPRRPPDRRSPVAGPSVLRTPRMKPERKELRVSPRAQMEPLQTLKPADVPLMSVPTQELALSPLLDTQQLNAHGMTKLQQRHISQTLGITLSTDQMKKGIILSEILGPPKAVLRRRHLAPGR